MTQEGLTREILLRAVDLIARQPIPPSPMFPVVPMPLKEEIARLDRIVIPRRNPEYGSGPAANSLNSYHHFRVGHMILMQEEDLGIGDRR